MGFGMKSFFIICLLAFIHSSHGCTMEDVSVWQVPITVRIQDYHEGIIFQRGISNIGGFNLISYNDLNGGPYVVAAIENSAFVLRTNEAFKEYEENETSDLISLTFSFSCTNGASIPSPLTIRIETSDNNNNPPLFKTPDTAASATTAYEFTIATPVPPGFIITNSVSNIIVRDIDLTTQRIDFRIENNPYVEIAYDAVASTDPKEFKAVLRTTTFIRSIPEPVILTISATDVDLTGDPPITRSTTLTIQGNTDFELPLELVFSQAFYFASYTENHQLILEQSISLQQGYDELVEFFLEGDYVRDYFTIAVNSNHQVILSVINPLPAAAMHEAQIYLVVSASREFTNGASATIVVLLPEVVGLEFEPPQHEGEIVDNTLQLPQLILSQGYHGADRTVNVEGNYTSTGVTVPVRINYAPSDITVTEEDNYAPTDVTATAVGNYAITGVTVTVIGNHAPVGVTVKLQYNYEPTYVTVIVKGNYVSTDIAVTVDRNFAPTNIIVTVEGNHASTDVIVTARGNYMHNNDVTVTVNGNYASSHVTVPVEYNYAPTDVTVTVDTNYASSYVAVPIEYNYARTEGTLTVKGNFMSTDVTVPVRYSYFPTDITRTIGTNVRSTLIRWFHRNMDLDMGKEAVRRTQLRAQIWQNIWHVKRFTSLAHVTDV